MDKIAGLNRQAVLVVCSLLTRYLDPNVPEELMSAYCPMGVDVHRAIPVTNGATHFPPGA